jgi:hypothetical protein
MRAKTCNIEKQKWNIEPSQIDYFKYIDFQITK